MNQVPRLLGLTQCASCGTTIRLDEVILVTFRISEHITDTEHVCSERCRQNLYLHQLRGCGL